MGLVTFDANDPAGSGDHGLNIEFRPADRLLFPANLFR
jgi:hypothetical protein